MTELESAQELFIELFEAAKTGDIETIKKFKYELDLVNAVNGDISDIEMRKKYQTSPTDQYDDELSTPIHVATFYEKLETVQELAAYGADVNCQNSHGNNPLHIAARKNSEKIIEKLLNSNATVESRNKLGNTPLHEAVVHGCVISTLIIILKSTTLETQNNNQETPLLSVCKHLRNNQNNKSIAKILVIAGADTSLLSEEYKKTLDLNKFQSNPKNYEEEVLNTISDSKFKDLLSKIINENNNRNPKPGFWETRLGKIEFGHNI